MNSLVIGGSERKTLQVVNELKRGGIDVHLAYLNEPHTQRDKVDISVPVACLDRRARISPGAVRALMAYVKRFNISKIVCVNLHPMIYAMAARVLLRLEGRLSIVLLVNSTELIGWKHKLAMIVYAPLMRRAERIVFGCRAQRDLWVQRYGLSEYCCEVVYNGVDAERFSPVAEPAAMVGRANSGAPGRFMVGSVGQLRPVKNHVELVQAFAYVKSLVPHARLVIAGEGPERGRIEAQIRQRRLGDCVQLVGQVDDVRSILRSIDVFVLPSISETFSNAALEAMAMGKVVVLSDTGGAREMVQDLVSGYIYPSGRPSELAALLVRIASDVAVRRQVGQQARNVILQRFSSERMFREYQRLVTGNLLVDAIRP